MGKFWLGLLLTGISIAGITAVATACLWDSDTLSEEAKGIPKVLDAIVGRVRVYPPEYYQFRIKLAKRALDKNPNNLNALDDLMVSHDHLGQRSRALQFAEMKRKVLQITPAIKRGDHEYRYYSNLGTIQAHKAFDSKKPNLALLKQSIRSLEKGLAINPNAHFGREKYQVLLYKILLRDPKKDEIRRERWFQAVNKDGYMKAQNAVLGMIAMGDGPESPVLLQALFGTIREKDAVVSELLYKRLDELKVPGKDILLSPEYWDISDHRIIDQQYKALRKEAKQYRAKLTAFVKQKVSRGRHPDNDPKFWSDWKEPARLSLADMERKHAENLRRLAKNRAAVPKAQSSVNPVPTNNAAPLVAVGSSVVVAGGVLIFVRRKRRSL